MYEQTVYNTFTRIFRAYEGLAAVPFFKSRFQRGFRSLELPFTKTITIVVPMAGDIRRSSSGPSSYLSSRSRQLTPDWPVPAAASSWWFRCTHDECVYTRDMDVADDVVKS